MSNRTELETKLRVSKEDREISNWHFQGKYFQIKPEREMTSKVPATAASP
jgi:hypothetical protein